MKELTIEMRRKLVDALRELPSVTTRSGRDQLLLDLPSGLQSSIPRSDSVMLDLINIVEATEQWGGEALDQLITNAIAWAPSSRASTSLESLFLRRSTENENDEFVRVYYPPPLPPQGIYGREKILSDLFGLLTLDDEGAVEVSPVALLGMGGVGKTTLAIALARREYIRRLFPDGVLWAALGPNPTIRTLLNSWGRALGEDLLPERDELACRDRLRDILYSRRSLLVIDDVWEEVHGSYFQVAGPRCRTVFTTREPPVAYALATRERTLRVDVLSLEASMTLLSRLAPDAVSTEEDIAKRLCERLEFLPLALTLAGRLLATESDIPSRMRRLVDELLEHREARLGLVQAEGRFGFEGAEPLSLQTILGMSVGRLNKKDQERFAMSAVFGGEPLTWEINAAASVWECAVEEAEATTSRLIQRGLVERRGERYWMHALLADYAAVMLDELSL